LGVDSNGKVGWVTGIEHVNGKFIVRFSDEDGFEAGQKVWDESDLEGYNPLGVDNQGDFDRKAFANSVGLPLFGNRPEAAKMKSEEELRLENLRSESNKQGVMIAQLTQNLKENREEARKAQEQAKAQAAEYAKLCSQIMEQFKNITADKIQHKSELKVAMENHTKSKEAIEDLRQQVAANKASEELLVKTELARIALEAQLSECSTEQKTNAPTEVPVPLVSPPPPPSHSALLPESGHAHRGASVAESQLLSASGVNRNASGRGAAYHVQKVAHLPGQSPAPKYTQEQLAANARSLSLANQAAKAEQKRAKQAAAVEEAKRVLKKQHLEAQRLAAAVAKDKEESAKLTRLATQAALDAPDPLQGAVPESAVSQDFQTAHQATHQSGARRQ